MSKLNITGESLRLLKLSLVCAGIFSLVGCATTTGISANRALHESQRESVCALWRGISWEDGDTDETIEEVKLNNARRDGFCGTQ